MTGLPIPSSVPPAADLSAQLDAWVTRTLLQTVAPAQATSSAPAGPVDVEQALLPVIAGGQLGLERALAGYRQDLLVSAFRRDGALVAALVLLAEGAPAATRPGALPPGVLAWPVLATLGPVVVRTDPAAGTQPAAGADLRIAVSLVVSGRELPLLLLTVQPGGSGLIAATVDRDALTSAVSLLPPGPQGAARSEQAVLDVLVKAASRLVLDAPVTTQSRPTSPVVDPSLRELVTAMLTRPAEPAAPVRDIPLLVPVAAASLATAGPAAFVLADRPASAFLLLLVGPSLTPPAPLPLDPEVPASRVTRNRACACTCEHCRAGDHADCPTGCLAVSTRM